MPETYLQWHYRSNHESLISFSNAAFYESKLCTFPSADDAVSHVTYVPVEGFYEGGGRCTAEAKELVREVKRRFKSKEENGKSIGIITFNAKQQNLVEDLLEKAYYNDPKLEKWATSGDEPLFVKNLENVQGDERDVILLSVTYGPDQTGRTLMRFGPLNNEGGWRRLNVAITRAREEMKVFSVLDPLQIDESRINSKGVRALRNFLVFAKQGGAPNEAEDYPLLNVRASHDAIADKICQTLAGCGYKAVRNIGGSSYKVDVAVLDPYDSNRYLAGILLDGSSYGRAKTTRDREIARQKMLEALGWNITNVWAMDWWSRKEHVVEGLLAFLDHCLGSSERMASRLIAKQEAQDQSEETKQTELLAEEDNDVIEAEEAFSDFPGRQDRIGAKKNEPTNGLVDGRQEQVQLELGLDEDVVYGWDINPDESQPEDYDWFAEDNDSEGLHTNEVDDVKPENDSAGIVEAPSSKSDKGERKLLSRQSLSKTGPTAYIRASLSYTPMSVDEFMSVETDREISERIKLVLEVEAPVQASYLKRKVKESFGFEKGTGEVNSKINYILRCTPCTATVFNNSRYYWRKDQDPEAYSTYRVTDGVARPIEEMCYEELRAAILESVGKAKFVSRGDAISKAARLLGYKRAGKKVIEAIDKAINRMINEGYIKKDGKRVIWVPFA